jgi:hypothetical protein
MPKLKTIHYYHIKSKKGNYLVVSDLNDVHTETSDIKKASTFTQKEATQIMLGYANQPEGWKVVPVKKVKKTT